MEDLIGYLSNEKLLRLVARKVGVLSVIVGVIFLQLQPQLKLFAFTMIIIGGLEAGVLFLGVFWHQDKAEKTIQEYTTNPKEFSKDQIVHIQKALMSFFC